MLLHPDVTPQKCILYPAGWAADDRARPSQRSGESGGQWICRWGLDNFWSLTWFFPNFRSWWSWSMSVVPLVRSSIPSSELLFLLPGCCSVIWPGAFAGAVVYHATGEWLEVRHLLIYLAVKIIRLSSLSVWWHQKRADADRSFNITFSYCEKPGYRGEWTILPIPIGVSFSKERVHEGVLLLIHADSSREHAIPSEL